MKKKTKCLFFSIVFFILTISIYWFGEHHCKTVSSVTGDSMLPSLNENDQLYCTNKKPEYGDIVTVDFDPAFVEYCYKATGDPDDGCHFVKRLIGLPGDTIKVTSEGVYRNGELLAEDYLPEENRLASFARDTDPYLEYTLDNDEYYVMGDNRAVSLDSRTIGPAHAQYIHMQSTTFTWYSQRFEILLWIGRVIIVFFIIRWIYLDRKEKKCEISSEI